MDEAVRATLVVMRGEQRAYCAEMIVEHDRATYTVVLALFTLFVAMTVLSAFVLDWFVGQHNGTRMSMDLWSVNQCSYTGCWSRPFERTGVGAFRWCAATTLWLVAVATLPIVIQTATYLLGRTPYRRLNTVAFIASVLAIISVAFTASEGTRVMPVVTAPFVLVLGLVVGLLGMVIATKRGPRPHFDRATRIPIARVIVVRSLAEPRPRAP